MEINIWGNSPGNYSYYDYSSGNYGVQLTEAGTFSLNSAPGGGQTFPAKYAFDVTAAPSCSNDFVVIGIPRTRRRGQANIVGVNNLYSSPGSTGFCPTNGPTVKFAYASGSGQVPASVTISLTGTQIAYVENLLTGSSYFHVLTIGTTENEGASATRQWRQALEGATPLMRECCFLRTAARQTRNPQTAFTLITAAISLTPRPIAGPGTVPATFTRLATCSAAVRHRRFSGASPSMPYRPLLCTIRVEQGLFYRQQRSHRLCDGQRRVTLGGLWPGSGPRQHG